MELPLSSATQQHTTRPQWSSLNWDQTWRLPPYIDRSTRHH